MLLLKYLGFRELHRDGWTVQDALWRKIWRDSWWGKWVDLVSEFDGRCVFIIGGAEQYDEFRIIELIDVCFSVCFDIIQLLCGYTLKQLCRTVIDIRCIFTVLFGLSDFPDIFNQLKLRSNLRQPNKKLDLTSIELEFQDGDIHIKLRTSNNKQRNPFHFQPNSTHLDEQPSNEFELHIKLSNIESNFISLDLPYCSSKNFGLAGIEYGSECYCGYALTNNSTLGHSGCTSLCSGDKSEVCGGSKLLSVYNDTSFMPPSIPQKVGDYNYTGSYKELANARAITGYSVTSTSSMTVEMCVGACQTKGYALAALNMAASVSAGIRSARQVLLLLIASVKSCCVRRTAKNGVRQEVIYKCSRVDRAFRAQRLWGFV
ncbi:hypothetical protein F5882DRAFT_463722 [Hyaloscypha sp. PMI_1271]|nr:hypothetical protein F5882DRAFT_463722 [Hyaloscypha sp. PMI_1271]